MSFLSITLIIVSVIACVLLYTTINLLRKNEKLEESNNQYESYQEQYEQFIRMITETIKQSDIKLQEIDKRGAYSSDDEIGWFFKQVKYLQSLLNQFKVK